MSNWALFEALGLNMFLAMDRVVNLAVQDVEIWLKGRAVDWNMHRALDRAVDKAVYDGLKKNRPHPGLSLYLEEAG